MSLGERARLRISGEDAFGEKEFRYEKKRLCGKRKEGQHVKHSS